jgi:hypothetical protein
MKMATKLKEGWFGAKSRGKRTSAPIHELKPNPWNPNKQSAMVASRMGVSMSKFGIIKELLVRQIGPNNKEGFGKAKIAAYQIVDGEHRWKEIQSAGLSTVEIRDLGIMADYEAKELTVVMNELSGDPNPIKLSSLISELEKAGLREDFEEIAPYTTEEVDTLLKIQDIEDSELFGGEDKKSKKDNKKDEAYTFQIGPHRGILPQDVAEKFETVMTKVAEKLATTDTVVIVSAISKILETMQSVKR